MAHPKYPLTSFAYHKLNSGPWDVGFTGQWSIIISAVILFVVVLFAGRLSPCHRQSALFVVAASGGGGSNGCALFAQTCRPNEPNNTSNAL